MLVTREDLGFSRAGGSSERLSNFEARPPEQLQCWCGHQHGNFVTPTLCRDGVARGGWTCKDTRMVAWRGLSWKTSADILERDNF